MPLIFSLCGAEGGISHSTFCFAHKSLQWNNTRCGQRVLIIIHLSPALALCCDYPQKKSWALSEVVMIPQCSENVRKLVPVGGAWSSSFPTLTLLCVISLWGLLLMIFFTDFSICTYLLLTCLLKVRWVMLSTVRHFISSHACISITTYVPCLPFKSIQLKQRFTVLMKLITH